MSSTNPNINPYALNNPNDIKDNSTVYRGTGMSINKNNNTVYILIDGHTSPTPFKYKESDEAALESLATTNTRFQFRSLPNSFRGNVIQWFTTTPSGNEFKQLPKYGY